MSIRTPSFWFYNICMAFREPIHRIWDLRVNDPCNVPREGGCLIVSNHESYIDPWVLCAALSREPVRFLINEPWYRRSRLWRVVFDGYGAIPAADGDPTETVRRVCSVLGEGGVVGLFPEGRVSPDGRLLPFQPGVALMAASSAAPVVPCGLHGTRRAAPWPRKVPRPSPLRVTVGEPMRFPGSPTAEPSARDVLRFTSEIAVRVATLVSSSAAPPSGERAVGRSRGSVAGRPRRAWSRRQPP